MSYIRWNPNPFYMFMSSTNDGLETHSCIGNFITNWTYEQIKNNELKYFREVIGSDRTCTKEWSKVFFQSIRKYYQDYKEYAEDNSLLRGV